MFNYLNTVFNDKDINKVSEIFQEIVTNYDSIKYRGNVNETQVNLDSYVKDKLKDIAGILSNRFNITIDFKTDSRRVCAIVPSPNNIAFEIKNKLKDELDKKVITSGLTDIVERLVYTLDKMEYDLAKDGIRMDTENVKIVNNNNYKFFILINIPFMIKKGLNGREITAIILHEIGHVFEGIYTLPNLIKNNLDITLNILSRLNNKEDPKEVIFKLYEDKLEEPIVTEDLTPEVVFNLYKKYTFDKFVFFTGYNSPYSKENNADMLSVKFGYGVDLARALSKVGDLQETDTFYFLGMSIGLILVIGIIIFMFGLKGLLTMLIVLGSVSIGILIIVAGMIAFFVWLFSKLFGTQQLTENKNLDTHEDIETRIKRIKNKIISLAHKVNNKEQAIEIIKQVKSLNNLIRNLNKDWGLKLNKLISVNSEYEAITIADNLINNELFIQSLRLKYLKGD